MKLITNPKLSLAIGLAALALAFIIERFSPDNQGLSFVEGFLFAVSIAFIIKYLTSHRKTQKT